MFVRKAHLRPAVPLLAALALIATAGSSGSAAGATAPAVRTATAATATAAVPASQAPQATSSATVLGSAGWQVLSSATATQGGATISNPGFSTSGWLPVSNDDGGAPGTEIEALLQNGSCPNVYYSTNMKTCFGSMSKIGADTVPQFDVPWWYRTTFNASLTTGQTASLIVNGVVGQADVWLNGTEVATQATVEGAYTRYTFGVTGLLKSGANSVALELYPNNPNTMLTLDDVDWSQIPPDNNTGIQFPVQLLVSDGLSDADSHVVQANATDLSSSALTVRTNVTNSTSAALTGTVSATVTAPAGGAAPITVSQSVTVPANTTQTVSFTPSAYPSLTIAHPQVWWPYQMGAQPLYTLSTSVTQGSTVSTATSGTFGIRNVSSSLVGAGPVDSLGVRQYSVNGVPFVVRGGGFTEDLFLHYSAAGIAQQIAILKNLGINMIRLEGHEFPDDFYEQMDQAGIMIDSGYQCCDAWGNNLSGNLLTVATNSALTIGENQVDHPSVVTFSWSDNAPGTADESDTLAAFKTADFDVPVVSSAEENSSPILGDSGEKEGPYDWVPPDYWYDTTHTQPDDNQTNAGGSWGFDSEESAGDTIPTLDSINRFLSPTEQSDLWQSDTYNQYHLNYESGHGQYQFGTLYNFDQALDARYGTPTSLDNYVEEAQVANYENTRAQFEAFIDHSTNTSTPSTGTMYWQVNKGWPTLLWDLYNEDGDQAGSYFGAKKGNETLHALYAQDTGTVTLDNLGGGTQSGLSVESKVYSAAGAVLDDQTASGISLASQKVLNSVLKPKVPATTTSKSAAQTYFVELTIRQNGSVVDRNTYWQSTYPDVVNWSSTNGNDNATMTQYADLQGLNSLPAGAVSATATSQGQPGPNGSDTVTEVTLTDTSSSAVGFFLRTDLRRGSASGTPQSGDNEVPSALWSDNDITLFPGESQTVSVSYKASDLNGATPVVSLSGYNVGTSDIAAPIGGGGGQPGNDFSVAVSPASGSVAAGGSATATVSTAVASGSAEPVALTASGLPSGVTASFAPASVSSGTGSTLTLATTSATAAGSYPVTVTGTAASGSHTTSYTLTVTGSGGSPGGRTYEADQATLGGSADANNCSACLDGQKVSDIGGGSNGTVTFTGITEPSTGSYTLTISYLSVGKARPATITVNGTTQTVTFTETSASSYNVIGTTTVTVTLNAGSGNTVEFSGSGTSGAPDLDHIVV
ncbi:beta-mannosidase [Streptacidiphilus sp. P02-A3a]|uniref:glycosyl hydrolase 2 galactose-binding domain-containing protein n=1 Tax=Streptacidiphilus sp. P02-A3a TaxID=2704468 RepID=UPI0015FB3175|nr:beta-mannosidase [Streptacidiphilus sp. P02-A3a]QMU68798.1 beta-mannosidase [Streptacidiphilus sp. P02-A3a]